MICAVIFDMDGLLIDSEPLWEKAEIEVFNKVGVPLTADMTSQTVGLRIDEVVRHWHNLYPWEGPTLKEVETNIVNKLISLVKLYGEPKSGAIKVIEFFKSKRIPMAIATSSNTQIIDAVLEKLKLVGIFDVICSAEDELYGKPHPGVYLTTAKKLGIDPEYCLTFEDSPNGVLSAKAAQMKCIAVPDEKTKNDRRISTADLVIDLLDLFNEKMFVKLF